MVIFLNLSVTISQFASRVIRAQGIEISSASNIILRYMANSKNDIKASKYRASHSEPLKENLVLIAVAAAIAVITFIVFIPSLKGEFLIWDDNLLVADNHYIQNINFEFFKWAFTDVAIASWYPVTVTSFAIDYAIWGKDPFGYHLTNTVFHSLNVMLVFFLTFRLVTLGRREKGNNGTLPFVAALVVAILFGIHPLRVESVAWTAERKDVLYSFFYILSILSYLRYSSLTNRKTTYYWASVIFFAMSLMSKSMAVTLPVILLILDYFPLRRLFSGEGITEIKKVVLEKVPFFLLSILVSAITVLTHHDSGAMMGLESHPLHVRLLVAIKGYILYLYKMILPVDLAPYYPYPNKITIVSSEYLIPILLFITFTVVSIVLIKKSKAVTAVWLYYILTLLPVIGIAQTGSFSAANRYTYLPCLGPLILIGILSGRAYASAGSRYLRMVFIVLLLIVSSYYVGMTLKEIPVWKDTESLWSRQIELHPGRIPLAYLNRGVVRYERKDYENAVNDYNMAIRLDPKHAKAYSNRGSVYEASGRYKLAVRDFTKAIELSPELAGVYSNRGNIFLKMKKYEYAVNDYKKAIEIDPEYAKAYSNLGVVYGAMGDPEMALRQYDRSIELSPWNARSYNNRGYTYEGMGRYEEALREYNKAIELEPEYTRVYNNRGSTYRKMGDFKNAVKDYSLVIKVDPDNATAHFFLAICYEKMGRQQESINVMKRAAELGSKKAKNYIKKRYIN